VGILQEIISATVKLDSSLLNMSSSAERDSALSGFRLSKSIIALYKHKYPPMRCAIDHNVNEFDASHHQQFYRAEPIPGCMQCCSEIRVHCVPEGRRYDRPTYWELTCAQKLTRSQLNLALHGNEKQTERQTPMRQSHGWQHDRSAVAKFTVSRVWQFQR